VKLPNGDQIHLTYCTNIHPANGWDAVFTNLKRYAPALKARFSPSAPFGLGLRLSAREARQLLEVDRVREFRSFLDAAGLYVALINGFPHGAFHGTVVKAEVYAPDWRDEARVRYTHDLIEILRQLLPEGVEGGISTAPLSYKTWMADADPGAWETVTRNVVRVAEALVRVRQAEGKVIHLDIEPEPDCSLENTDETLEFFTGRLVGRGSPMLAAALRISEGEARERLLEHIQVCFDCCHFAVEFEDAARAIDRFRAAGIRIGRVQLSSALRVRFPDDPIECARVAEHLRPFADATYLHQVVEGSPDRLGTGSELRRYPDLGDALARAPEAASKEWRIHFHVPLFTARYDLFESTQGYVRDVLRTMLRTAGTQHLEIETYTWDVLPEGLKADLLESISREYEWVLESLIPNP
jgi:sugar phosphate isomerase/epimerase